MGFKDLFTELKKDGTARLLTATYVEWKKSGDQIIGRLLNKNAVSSRLGGGEYYQYMFDTDGGLVKCALGKATDGEAGALMGLGGVYSIVYKGTEKIGGGRQLNRFEILELQSPSGGGSDGGGDVPF